MDLPTYTSIWRIEKRLYKLYDFRLPMPLPIGQVTVFVAIAVPYVVLLTVLGLPFNHTLIWLYLLPPGFATWLVTRPVLESKRLPELVKSQLRYLAEPRILCRMAPLTERDVVLVSGRIWRPRAARHAEVATEEAAEAGLAPADEFAASPLTTPGRMRRGPLPPARTREQVMVAAGAHADPGALPSWIAAAPPRRAANQPPAYQEPTPHQPAPRPASEVAAVAGRRMTPAEFRLAASARPASSRAPAADPAPPRTPVADSAPRADPPMPQADLPIQQADLPIQQADLPIQQADLPIQQADLPPAEDQPMPPEPAPSAAEAPAPADQASDPSMGVTPSTAESDGCHTHAGPAAAEAPEHVAQQARPVVTVVGAGAGRTAAPSVERALAGPSARRGDVRAGRVAVVPGGHRPGKPDMLQRDRSRARLPIGIRPRIVVLGCTVGAGQTMTTLMAGEVLASLRQDQVAAMDLNPGSGSLGRRAEGRPALSQAALTGRSRLVVIGPRTQADHDAAGGPRDPAIDAITFEAATDRYDVVLADPATVAVPRLLGVADQLILVAPASSAAPGAIAMTFEWLEAHGQSALTAGSIMVLNGVSRRSSSHVEQAERVCAGRCRAIVRIPWDDQLQHQVGKRVLVSGPGSQMRQHWTGVLNPATAAAYTALAGVVVASLAGQGAGEGQTAEPAHAGQVQR